MATVHSSAAPADAVSKGDLGDWLAQVPLGTQSTAVAPIPTGFAACALTAGPEAPGHARSFARSTLDDWGMDGLADDTAIVVTELTSNAVRYGVDDSARSRSIWLGLLRNHGTVLCTVSDHTTEVPVLRSADALAESGRGLQVVDRVSASWGWTPPGQDGKAVWAVISPA